MLIEEHSTETKNKRNEIGVVTHALIYSFEIYLDTPIFPNVRVREISGRIQARFLRCCGCRIQSSQKLLQEFYSISILNWERENQAE